MGQIVFEEEPPFELVNQKEPVAIADEGFVILNFAVFAAGYPRATADVQVRITMEQAAALALQLAPALAVAKGQSERLRIEDSSV
jgi:hypothetical protein